MSGRIQSPASVHLHKKMKTHGVAESLLQLAKKPDVQQETFNTAEAKLPSVREEKLRLIVEEQKQQLEQQAQMR